VRIVLGLRWLPVPSRGDLVGGAQVPAARVVPPDLEALLNEPGIEVDRVTPYRWVQRTVGDRRGSAGPTPQFPMATAFDELIRAI